MYLHRAILLTQCETLAAHNCEGTEQLHKIIINYLYEKLAAFWL